MKKHKKSTIEDLEKILENNDDSIININPDGSISTSKRRRKKPKIIIHSISDIASSY